MARLRALMEDKQAAFRRHAGDGRLPVVTLKANDADRARGVTPALSDNFLPIEIIEILPANQMLWVGVSHLNKGGDGSAPTWRVFPNG
jgi:hypothetical protein